MTDSDARRPRLLRGSRRRARSPSCARRGPHRRGPRSRRGVDRGALRHQGPPIARRRDQPGHRAGPDRCRGHRPRRTTPDGPGVHGSDPPGPHRRALRARPRPVRRVAVAAVRGAGADRWRRWATPPTSCAGSGPARPSRTTGPPGRSPSCACPSVPTSRRRLSCLPRSAPRPSRSPVSAFDGVILHPFLTPDAVGRSLALVRDAATAAGPGPELLRCCATVVVAPDRTDGDTALAVGARAAGYFQLRGLGDALAARQRMGRRGPRGATAGSRSWPELGERSADKSLTRDELIELSRAMPADWLPSASAVGDAATCAARLRGVPGRRRRRARPPRQHRRAPRRTDRGLRDRGDP